MINNATEPEIVIPDFDYSMVFADKEMRTASLNQHAGIMEVAFNAFYVIDTFDAKRATVPMESGVTPGTHNINFFVRLGRKPVGTTGE